MEAYSLNRSHPDTFVVGKTKNLQGVYNINKGYAVFRKVSVLCETTNIISCRKTNRMVFLIMTISCRKVQA